MPRSRALFIVGLWVTAVGGFTSPFFGQTLQIDIPNKTFNLHPPFQIATVKLTFSFASVPNVRITGVNLTVTSSDLPGQPWTPPMLTFNGNFVCSNPPSSTDFCHDFAPAGVGVDHATLSHPDPPGYDSDHYQRYELDIDLKSNYVLTSCNGTQSGLIGSFDHYTIIATPVTVVVDPTQPAPSPILSTCLESYDHDVMGVSNCLGTPTHFVPIADTPADLEINNVTQARALCFKERPGVDVVLVLDKSGSMASSTTALGSTRMAALQTAVSRLMTVWSDLRSREAVSGSSPTDNIGGVLFDSAVNTTVPLTPFSAATITNTVNSAAPSGSTSVGAGLHAADQSLTAGTSPRRIILLMTDGQQNTDPFVKDGLGLYCNSAANCATLLKTTPTCDYTSVNPCPLSNALQSYTVRVGPSTGLGPAIEQDIANATLGFYLQTETDAGVLSPFFLELLQNVLKFYSYDTVRLISRTTPYSAMVPISPTSHDVEFSLMWPSNLGALQITISPPGGGPPIVKESASGFITIVQPLPLPVPFNPAGDWSIQVKAIDLAQHTAAVTTGNGRVPFDLHAMTDDGVVKSDLSVVPGDYKSGDKIRLRAKLTQFGSPILGLGTHAGDKIYVDLIKPGQSIGDMLSDNTASSVPSCPDPQSPSCDPQSAAEAKLANALKNDPSALTHAPDTIPQLFDDGKPEHGDDVAGDGIYSALFATVKPGPYNFLFSIERTDPSSVRFSRQQLRTAYVRAVPDAGNTVFQSSVLRRDKSSVLSIVMTPRVKPGPGCAKTDPKCGRMGPGWANYFWFTTPGQTPFKPTDNLNGTYTATLGFTGARPPQVSVHFENVLAEIADSVAPDHLPDPLGPRNIFTDVPPPGGGKLAGFFDVGADIPHGTFGSAFNTGFSLNTGLEYIVTSHFSVDGIFGYHHFPAKIGSDLNLYQFSVNGKAYLTTGSIQPFVNVGIGDYKFSPGSSYFSGNFGGGLLYIITPHWGLQGSYNFHAVNTPVAATKLSTLQAGIRFVF